MFEILADLTDEDGGLAEIEDYEAMDKWIFDIDPLMPPEEPPDIPLEESPAEPQPTGENLLNIKT